MSTTEKTIKTKIHAYCLDVSQPDQNKAYSDICAMMKANGVKCFKTWEGNKGHYSHVSDIDGQEIELETKFLFDNQWNTAPIPGKSESGLRVFDWAQDYPINFGKHIKRGHYLEITEEMRQVRHNQFVCGYCGHRTTEPGDGFCHACLGSEYLKSAEIHFLRLKRVSDKSDRAELTEAESEMLLPLYRDAQIYGNQKRAEDRTKAEREAIQKKYDEVANGFDELLKNATTERDGKLWLLDHGLNTDNVIYYKHTGRFCFGWKKPVDSAVRDQLLNVISELHYPYEIVCDDGKELEPPLRGLEWPGIGQNKKGTESMMVINIEKPHKIPFSPIASIDTDIRGHGRDKYAHVRVECEDGTEYFRNFWPDVSGDEIRADFERDQKHWRVI